MKALGVASWDGGTSNELVASHFTIPSEKVDDGIAFWANAVRFPLFDREELATEERVVINEFRGYLNDPQRLGAMLDATLGRLPAGSVSVGVPPHQTIRRS